MNPEPAERKLSNGVIRKPLDEAAARMNASVFFDYRLAEADLEGSRAHAKMLAQVGLLSPQERDALLRGLEAVGRRVRAGTFEWDPGQEDVHLNLERAVTAWICQHEPGAVKGAGEKLHTARSRNDQVALDLRLWTRAAIDELQKGIARLQLALARQAANYASALCPGLTHLQPAMPVTLGHQLLSYVEMLERDRQRLADARRRVNVSPLGACALAGTALPIDPAATARELGMEATFGNSMDAVADRDFLMETLAALAILGVHLSRLAEDMLLLASPRFGFLRLGESFSTGSSIMPHKRNPDLFELVRGKSARLCAALVSLLVLAKGLPSTYNKDLQENQPPLFDAVEQAQASLEVLARAFEDPDLYFDVPRMLAACQWGFLDSVSLTDFLVERGVPFRQAHRIVGEAVRRAEAAGKSLAELADAELLAVDPRLEAGCRAWLGAQNVVSRYRSPGSANPKLVAQAAQSWLERLTGLSRP